MLLTSVAESKQLRCYDVKLGTCTFVRVAGAVLALPRLLCPDAQSLPLTGLSCSSLFPFGGTQPA